MKIEIEVIVDQFSDNREPIARVRKVVFSSGGRFLGSALLSNIGEWVVLGIGK